MKNKRCIEEFKQWLIQWTGGCEVNNNGWPCATCTCALLSDLGVKEDKDHNKPIDRVNEVWRAILQIRGEDKE